MTDAPLRRTIRRSAAVLVLALMLLLFYFEHYLAYRGIPTHSGIRILSILLAGGSGLYLVGSFFVWFLKTDE